MSNIREHNASHLQKGIQMNKKERFYQEVLKRKVVNVQDLKHISKKVFDVEDEYYYRKYLHKLIKEAKLKKVRKGLYYGIPLDKLEEDFQADRYLVGNKLEKCDALGYHTALELHGSAHSAFTRIFIIVAKKNRFRRFDFQGVGYIPVVNKHHLGHITSIEYKNTSLKVTDLERTFVDCLSRTDLCGGWEECLKSLANLKGISLKNIKDVLSSYNNKTLELKCGYVLEMLRDRSPYYEHIEKEKLKPLRPTPGWKPVYIDRDVSSELKKRWGLYVPKHLEDLLRGV